MKTFEMTMDRDRRKPLIDQCDASDIVQDDAKCDECGVSLRGTESIRLRPKRLRNGGKWFCQQHVPFEVIDRN